MYLPPGVVHEQSRHDTLQDVATLLRHLWCPWLVVGDWNNVMVPDDLVATGLPSFVRGTVIHPGVNACVQGKGSLIDYALVLESHPCLCGHGGALVAAPRAPNSHRPAAP